MRYSDAKPSARPSTRTRPIVTASYQYGESGSCCRWTTSVAMYGAFGKKRSQSARGREEHAAATTPPAIVDEDRER